MPLEIILTIAAVIILLVASAFFSGSETALTTASRARLHTLAGEGNARAMIVNKLMETPERVIGTVLLGNNLVNILATALATSLLIRLFGDVGVAYATVLVTGLVVIFSEVLPKTYAIAYAERFALAVGGTMQVAVKLLAPLTKAIDLIVRLVLKLTPTRIDDDANILAHKEIRGAIELQTKEGAVARHDRLADERVRQRRCGALTSALSECTGSGAGAVSAGRQSAAQCEADRYVLYAVCCVYGGSVVLTRLWWRHRRRCAVG